MTSLQISNTHCTDSALISALLAGEKFWPTEPRTLAETGLGEPFLEALLCKTLLIHGRMTGRQIAARCCLPFSLVESALDRLRAARALTHVGSAQFNDYLHALTDEGCERARRHQSESAYAGPAPVPLSDYIISVEAQAVSDEVIRRDDLLSAFWDVSVAPEMLSMLGPAVNSGSGMFLYGAPGNGKSTLARCITTCFGQDIWIPHAVIDGGEVIHLFDPAYHEPAGDAAALPAHDRRWVRIRRPTVVVGGELTMDSLELSHDRSTNVCEAPLQMKSNCGCLLIDDFGRQRISPQELLNRWIIPLENRHDFLTLGSGKKIQIPFEQLILFSTNLNPDDLVDEAFLRRIPYRIEVGDPDEREFHHLFQLEADRANCPYNPQAVEHLLEQYYRHSNRPKRRCHARDLMLLIRHHCVYHDLRFEMLPEYFDQVATRFFSCTQAKPTLPTQGNSPHTTEDVP